LSSQDPLFPYQWIIQKRPSGSRCHQLGSNVRDRHRAAPSSNAAVAGCAVSDGFAPECVACCGSPRFMLPGGAALPPASAALSEAASIELPCSAPLDAAVFVFPGEVSGA